MSAALRVIAGGMPATVQDAGRRGYECLGVPRSGAMDRFALAAANTLVGNHPAAATIEVTAGGAAFEALRPLLVALAGGDLKPHVEGVPAEQWTALLLAPGAQLGFAGRGVAGGARAYLAVAGGVDVPLLLGSRSTYLPGAWGGLDGRPLRPGDRLNAGMSGAAPYTLAGRRWSAQRPQYSSEPVLRLVPGPHSALLGGLDWLLDTPLTVDQASNRIGYRLAGAELVHNETLPSFGVLPGTLQLPPNGMPILLMADAQPTGGYPVLGVVAAADLPLAAQLLPGDSLRFALVSAPEARSALADQHNMLRHGLEDDPVRRLLDWAGA